MHYAAPGDVDDCESPVAGFMERDKQLLGVLVVSVRRPLAGPLGKLGMRVFCFRAFRVCRFVKN